MSSYTSYGPFAPIYIDKKRKLVDDNDRISFFVLEALSWHCDPLGQCYPGVRRLADQARYAPETVEVSLSKLLSLDYIRAHLQTMPSGRHSLLWQLSPWVLWIRPEYIATALSEWERATLRSWEKIASVINNDSNHTQPAIATRVKPAPNQSQTRVKPAPNQLRSTENGKTVPFESPAPTPPVANGNDKEKRIRGDNGLQSIDQIMAAQRATIQQPAGQKEDTPPVPPPPPGRDYSTPLPDQAGELVAESVQHLPPGTRIAQARELVDQFGAEAVRAAVQWAEREYKAGRALNPQGLLRSWLVKKQVQPNDNDNGNRYTSGEFGDLIIS